MALRTLILLLLVSLASPSCKPRYHCPPEMVQLTGLTVCMDRHEASLGEGQPGQADGSGTTAPAVSRAGVLPSLRISWRQASQACRLARKRLCREVEWQLACAGPDGARRFPYGTEYETGRCVDHSFTQKLGSSGPQPTGSAPDCRSPEGIFDLSGNVWEWLADTGPGGEPGHIAGGGAGNRDGKRLRCSAGKRIVQPTTTQAGAIGFRCCKDL